jgi:hypothetical protein
MVKFIHVWLTNAPRAAAFEFLEELNESPINKDMLTLGRPKETLTYNVNALEEMNMIGIYRIEEVSD